MSDSDNAAARHRFVDEAVAILQSRYPDRFNADQVELIRQGLVQLQAQAQTLRSMSLTNADEPDFIFRAFRAEE